MTIGITFSAFDLLHAGHITMLEDAKRQCDHLICALQTDPTIDRPEKNKPVQSVVERYIQLKGCVFVDEIVPYATEQDLEDILRSLNWMCASLETSMPTKILQEELTVKRKASLCILTKENTVFQVVAFAKRFTKKRS